ncbi:tail fiber domain-containing protein [Panacibacter ginsenosidivorans]|uniref:Tail fiber domain-containing protein n=2 Tax=Panacibacter ginsenosidivorans TaxID=1813871 RepID=A0A5B8V5R3_9BACT|nr:tail fiber domain-containing protein [Panacibacter ginsenosidivorans]QEC66740.1 tail fiber domain-containing protein [Panacibacter ginsenosidivorans]
MDKVLDKVMQLKPSLYHFTKQQSNDRRFMGMIAQEVQPLFPEAVYEQLGKNDKAEDYLSLDYTTFGIIAIKAIQEQQKEIEELKALLKGNTSVNQQPASVSQENAINVKLSTTSLEQTCLIPYAIQRVYVTIFLQMQRMLLS